MLASSEKKKVVETYRCHDKDTGSCEVQVAILTKRIEDVTGHFKLHPKDNNGRMGLFKMVSLRKRLLKYLKGDNLQRYNKVITSLGLRK